MAAAVQKLALSDATRCLDACIPAPSHSNGGDFASMLEESYHKARHWAQTRGPIAHWALRRWLETRLQVPLPPVVPSKLTLNEALAPLNTRTIYGKAFRIKPMKAMKIGARLLWMWMTRKLVPQEKRRRQLEPLMSEIAATYDELVQRELTAIVLRY